MSEYMSPCRTQFEEWISADPYNKAITHYRNPEWPPGYFQYSDTDVQLAWEAWAEAWERFRP